MKEFKTFLTIAGSDCIGGAGLQADIKTAQALGFYSASAVTCVTAQNSRGLQSVSKVSDKTLRRQLDCIFDDFTPDCIKIGMIPDPWAVKVIGDALRHYPHGVVVLDPVLAPTKGHGCYKPSAMARAILDNLRDVVDIITPNRREIKELALAANADPVIAKYLHGHAVEYLSHIMAEQGIPWLLVTGSDSASDILYDDEGRVTEFYGETVKTPNLHGTGCVFSSALACMLALGMPVPEAVAAAKDFLTDGLKAYSGLTFGSGYGPANFFI